ncbi:hypothetical protein BDZ88DRAFT_469071 [Geranomyces variabilis]|nr:hypothetical protein BDZ88DRAFT_469071 [Geranomyces variabilis]
MLVEEIDASRVRNIGCGQGQVQVFCQNFGLSVAAFDPDESNSRRSSDVISPSRRDAMSIAAQTGERCSQAGMICQPGDRGAGTFSSSARMTCCIDEIKSCKRGGGNFSTSNANEHVTGFFRQLRSFAGLGSPTLFSFTPETQQGKLTWLPITLVLVLSSRMQSIAAANTDGLHLNKIPGWEDVARVRNLPGAGLAHANCPDVMTLLSPRDIAANGRISMEFSDGMLRLKADTQEELFSASVDGLETSRRELEIFLLSSPPAPVTPRTIPKPDHPGHWGTPRIFYTLDEMYTPVGRKTPPPLDEIAKMEPGLIRRATEWQGKVCRMMNIAAFCERLLRMWQRRD